MSDEPPPESIEVGCVSLSFRWQNIRLCDRHAFDRADAQQALTWYAMVKACALEMTGPDRVKFALEQHRRVQKARRRDVACYRNTGQLDFHEASQTLFVYRWSETDDPSSFLVADRPDGVLVYGVRIKSATSEVLYPRP